MASRSNQVNLLLSLGENFIVVCCTSHIFLCRVYLINVYLYPKSYIADVNFGTKTNTRPLKGAFLQTEKFAIAINFGSSSTFYITCFQNAVLFMLLI